MSDNNEKHDDAADTSMISSPRPYQSTTEPVPHRRELCGGVIVDLKFVKSVMGMLLIKILLNANIIHGPWGKTFKKIKGCRSVKIH